MDSKFVLGGRFRVVDDGSVFRITKRGERPASINYTSENKRYAITTYCEGGKQNHVYVHRLIASAFLPNPDNLPYVNHIDGDSRNNAASNLEWCDNARNSKHAYDIGSHMKPCSFCASPTQNRVQVCDKCKEGER